MRMPPSCGPPSGSPRTNSRSRTGARAQEFLIHHAHAHLDVFVDGKPTLVPAGIGINIDDPEVCSGSRTQPRPPTCEELAARER
jgi:hypothetical protein